MTKTCTLCGENKEAEDFYTSNTTKDGLHSYCRKCSNALNRDNRRKRANKLKELETQVEKLTADNMELNQIRLSYQLGITPERLWFIFEDLADVMQVPVDEAAEVWNERFK